jgi:hypothetical protein
MDRDTRKQLIAAVVVASVAGMVMLAYRACNPGQGAEHYYMHKHKPMYCLMQLCTAVIFAAIGFNGRFIAGHVFTLLTDRMKKIVI